MATKLNQSQEWLAEALVILMKRKPFDQIKITEIAEKAGVSRLTFYRHFDNKEAVLLYRSTRLFETYLAELQATGNIKSLAEMLTLSFEYWQKDADFLRLVIKNDLIGLHETIFRTYLTQIGTDIPEFESLTKFQRYFIIGGVIQVMIDWIMTGTQESIQTIVTELLTLVDFKA